MCRCLAVAFVVAADLSQWSDLFNDLRHISSGSGNPPGSLTGLNSFTTDWIPELLSKRASGRIDPIAAAVAGTAPAAAADRGQAGAGGAAGAEGGNSQQQQQDAGATAAAAAAGGEGADVLGGADGAKGRKGKRERSKTGQAPTAEQRQEWQVRLLDTQSCISTVSIQDNTASVSYAAFEAMHAAQQHIAVSAEFTMGMARVRTVKHTF